MDFITLTKLTGESIIINRLYIMVVEKTPDTVVTLCDGSKFLVKESPDDITKDKREKQWTNSL